MDILNNVTKIYLAEYLAKNYGKVVSKLIRLNKNMYPYLYSGLTRPKTHIDKRDMRMLKGLQPNYYDRYRYTLDQIKDVPHEIRDIISQHNGLKLPEFILVNDYPVLDNLIQNYPRIQQRLRNSIDIVAQIFRLLFETDDIAKIMYMVKVLQQLQPNFRDYMRRLFNYEFHGRMVDYREFLVGYIRSPTVAKLVDVFTANKNYYQIIAKILDLVYQGGKLYDAAGAIDYLLSKNQGSFDLTDYVNKNATRKTTITPINPDSGTYTPGRFPTDPEYLAKRVDIGRVLTNYDQGTKDYYEGIDGAARLNYVDMVRLLVPLNTGNTDYDEAINYSTNADIVKILLPLNTGPHNYNFGIYQAFINNLMQKLQLLLPLNQRANNYDDYMNWYHKQSVEGVLLLDQYNQGPHNYDPILNNSSLFIDKPDLWQLYNRLNRGLHNYDELVNKLAGNLQTTLLDLKEAHKYNKGPRNYDAGINASTNFNDIEYLLTVNQGPANYDDGINNPNSNASKIRLLLSGNRGPQKYAQALYNNADNPEIVALLTNTKAKQDYSLAIIKAAKTCDREKLNEFIQSDQGRRNYTAAINSIGSECLDLLPTLLALDNGIKDYTPIIERVDDINILSQILQYNRIKPSNKSPFKAIIKDAAKNGDLAKIQLLVPYHVTNDNYNVAMELALKQMVKNNPQYNAKYVAVVQYLRQTSNFKPSLKLLDLARKKGVGYLFN